MRRLRSFVASAYALRAVADKRSLGWQGLCVWVARLGEGAGLTG
jgi:hypothetical protein